jgi:branched-chain amino acid transport system ATP-binding protein
VSKLGIEALTLRHGLLQAVRGADLQVAKGEIVALVGANGAGKTTLLRAIAGAHPVASGRITLDGVDLAGIPAHRRVAMGIALVPEGRRLFAQMTVEENLLLARDYGRPGPWSLQAVMDAYPNLQQRRRQKAGSLSGGEQQATAIGRALLANPDLLLLDEVSLGLAPLVVDRVYEQLQVLMQSGITVILVEQDLKRAMRTADRIVCMLEGRIVLQGAAKEIGRDAITSAYFGLHRAGDHLPRPDPSS